MASDTMSSISLPAPHVGFLPVHILVLLALLALQSALNTLYCLLTLLLTQYKSNSQYLIRCSSTYKR